MLITQCNATEDKAHGKISSFLNFAGYKSGIQGVLFITKYCNSFDIQCPYVWTHLLSKLLSHLLGIKEQVFAQEFVFSLGDASEFQSVHISVFELNTEIVTSLDSLIAGYDNGLMHDRTILFKDWLSSMTYRSHLKAFKIPLSKH